VSTEDFLFASAGLPVCVENIDRELARLWEEEAETKTRASLVNLAIYFENPEGISSNTAIIQSIASEHPCRALLVLGRPGAPESEVRAWISAHCYPLGRGAKQICSEQITFELAGEAIDSLPGIVFSHLDSDLPLVFWWQADFPATPRPDFWCWVDRLIFDSTTWPAALPNLDRVLAIGRASEHAGRLVLCDLNWTRLLSWRFALAALFDHDFALSRIHDIRHVEIANPPSNGVGSRLLLGWIASRLGWKLERQGAKWYFASSSNSVSFSLLESPSKEQSTSCACRIETGDAHFEILRNLPSSFFTLRWSIDGKIVDEQVIQGEAESPAALLLSELGRVGSRVGYHQSIDAVRPLFSEV